MLKERWRKWSGVSLYDVRECAEGKVELMSGMCTMFVSEAWLAECT